MLCLSKVGTRPNLYVRGLEVGRHVHGYASADAVRQSPLTTVVNAGCKRHTPRERVVWCDVLDADVIESGPQRDKRHHAVAVHRWSWQSYLAVQSAAIIFTDDTFRRSFADDAAAPAVAVAGLAAAPVALFGSTVPVTSMR